MSEIEEIRRRHQERQAGEEPADYSLAFEEAHEDRAALLAALDGEWQSERPAPGMWWVSIRPDLRPSPTRSCVVFPAVVACEVWAQNESHWVVRYSGGGDLLPLDQDWFTGALWQRRTVPGDPFAKGGG